MATGDEHESSERSRYAGLATDQRGHCSWFLTRTNKEHQATMEHAFMRTIYATTFDAGAYTSYLVSQYLLFSELEKACEANRGALPLSAVYDQSLLRTHALEQDLCFWGGENWIERTRTPSPETLAYLAQLQEDAADPFLLLCHHFLNYNAVLSGGQYLGGQVSTRARTTSGKQSSADSAVTGAAFYDFPADCQPTHARVQRYIEAFDELEISESTRDRMLVCMQYIYERLLGMFDEAYEIAPTEGMSYRESMNAAAPSAASTRVPPPPLTPADRKIGFAELLEHTGRHKQILTSVLGRIYDVSSASSFFGKGGAYEMFAGHDGTYNLAVMTLKKKTLDTFRYKLEQEEKECLADWIAYFDHNYGRPIGTLYGRAHPIQLSDLPRATKIPFQYEEDDEAVEQQQAQERVATEAPTSKL